MIEPVADLERAESLIGRDLLNTMCELSHLATQISGEDGLYKSLLPSIQNMSIDVSARLGETNARCAECLRDQRNDLRRDRDHSWLRGDHRPRIRLECRVYEEVVKARHETIDVLDNVRVTEFDLCCQYVGKSPKDGVSVCRRWLQILHGCRRW